jgi:chemotaxis protein MotB
MLSREKLYKANLLESGDKLAELASRNEGLTAALNAERERASVLQQDVARANAEAGVYGDELQSAELKLRELMAAQQKAEAERDRIAAESEQLRLSLTKELDDARLENITVQQARADNSIPITLGNADFFETGSAKLTEAGGQKLTQLANIIHSYHNHRIVVEGHTDNVPIGPMLLSRFASNWELSVARAAAAVRHMQSETDIDPHKLAAAGYGEFKPVGDNSTEEGKQLNRRIEVVLYPRKTEYKNIDDVGSITAIDE